MEIMLHTMRMGENNMLDHIKMENDMENILNIMIMVTLKIK